MSLKSIFEKGNFQKVSDNYRMEGLEALRDLSNFQIKHEQLDTDTTINSIRDSMVAHYLGYDLINTEKHGFDAKNSKTGNYLEVKQCSFSSNTWHGTWNDTNEEKAKAFGDSKVFTAVAIWYGASKLKFIVYGQNPELGILLHSKVVNRKTGSRSTQSISITKLIKDFGFKVYVPSGSTADEIMELINLKTNSLKKILNYDNVKKL